MVVFSSALRSGPAEDMVRGAVGQSEPERAEKARRRPCQEKSVSAALALGH